MSKRSALEGARAFAYIQRFEHQKLQREVAITFDGAAIALSTQSTGIKVTFEDSAGKLNVNSDPRLLGQFLNTFPENCAQSVLRALDTGSANISIEISSAVAKSCDDYAEQFFRNVTLKPGSRRLSRTTTSLELLNILAGGAATRNTTVGQIGRKYFHEKPPKIINLKLEDIQI